MRTGRIPVAHFRSSRGSYMMPALKRISRYTFSDRRNFARDSMKIMNGPSPPGAIHWAGLKRLFRNDPWGPQGPRGPRAKMAFMAVYNVDRFREFVFQSSFTKRYKVKTALLKKLEKIDVELLKFGFDWVKLFLWGMKSKQIRLR